MFDFVQSVLGEAIELHPHFQLQRPNVKLRDASTDTIIDTTVSDVPDLIVVTGSLKGSDTVQNGAILSVRFRRGQQFKGEASLTWHINCEQGEIRLIAPSGTSLQAHAYSEPVTIEIHNFATDEVHSVEWEWPKWEEEADIPIIGRSVAMMYEAFHAETVSGGSREYPDFGDASKRHEQLASLISQWAPS